MQDQREARDDADKRARKRVKKLREFYIGLVVYVVVNVGLFFVNWYTVSQGGDWWFFWVAGIWGVFVVISAVEVYLGSSHRGRGWEERKYQEFLDEEKRGESQVSQPASDDSSPAPPVSSRL